MPTLNQTVAAFVAANDFDLATISRLDFWTQQIGDREITDITEKDVRDGLMHLQQRGRLVPAKNRQAKPTNKPMAASTMNRYVSQLASVFKYAKGNYILPSSYVSPTSGIVRQKESVDKNRFLDADQVKAIVNAADLVDQRWGKLRALILLAYSTGLRKTNLLNLKWTDVDFANKTIFVEKTKNGDPIESELHDVCAVELKKLPRSGVYIFESPYTGKPFYFRKLWERACQVANLPGRNFHQLRHACGHRLGNGNVNQSTIMAIMGHRSLASSQRYMHADREGKRKAIQSAFGSSLF
jgi:integrase